MTVLVAVLATLLMVHGVYATWRIHTLVDERDDAREIAEEQRERLLARPVRIKTVIYANGEKYEALQK